MHCNTFCQKLEVKTMPIPSWVTMIATVLLQLVILLIAAGIIILIRQHFRFFKRLHVVPVDVWPPFLLTFIYWLSHQQVGGSLIPQVAIIWLTAGLIALVWQIFTDPKMTYRRYLVLFWRLSDLLLAISWLVVAIYMVVESI
ncbi:hypothetical protein HMPREF9103_00402 [Lentilactobacillus parafarraginis F0439]|uniref:DUF3397 domain-containing protein n=2 Tax=Lentilactobacillus parafarraginis TaxID=390842 RepID=G9ZL03_9LACO|nr:hypothetical protein HMPREF9103_00402 [Lentilactobacillus parafarraginis F0439]